MDTITYSNLSSHENDQANVFKYGLPNELKWRTTHAVYEKKYGKAHENKYERFSFKVKKIVEKYCKALI